METPMPETTMPQKGDESRIRDQINRSLEAALEEAERVGYISAEESERRTREFMKRIEQRVAAGEVKP
jgi:hypothetical protein